MNLKKIYAQLKAKAAEYIGTENEHLIYDEWRIAMTLLAFLAFEPEDSETAAHFRPDLIAVLTRMNISSL
ncbi:MAG: hypothetical protein RSF73_03060 [Ruthenibacterium sp.]